MPSSKKSFFFPKFVPNFLEQFMPLSSDKQTADFIHPEGLGTCTECFRMTTVHCVKTTRLGLVELFDFEPDFVCFGGVSVYRGMFLAF